MTSYQGASVNLEPNYHTEDAFYGSFRGRGKYRGRFYNNQGNQTEYPKPKIVGKNPLDFHGRYTKCNIGQSINHFERMCPDKERKDRNSALVADNDEEEREITLFTMKYDMKKRGQTGRDSLFWSNRGVRTVRRDPGVCCFRQCMLGHCLRRSIVDLLSRRPFES